MIFIKLCFMLTLVCMIGVTAQFLYLNTGVFKFIAGLGLPIDVETTGGSVSWFTNAQVFYKLPDNITHFEPYKILHKRSIRNTFNRPDLYPGFMKYFNRLGLYGTDCIYRIICEVASRRINHNENGLLGEIIHIIFSPGNENGFDEHKAAQWHGLYNKTDCKVTYKDCNIVENSIFLL